MLSDLSKMAGHRYAPGQEPTLEEKALMALASLAPYAGVIVALSILAIVLVVARWALRRVDMKREAEKKAVAADTRTPAQRRRDAERQRLRDAFEARQIANARVREEMRDAHFGNVVR